MTVTRQQWMSSKVTLATRLAAGELGAGYPEAIIILSSAVSAIAAEMWPGSGIDRKRFVEAMRLHSDPALSASRISIPMLVGHLRRAGTAGAHDCVRSHFMKDVFPTQVLTGENVDREDAAIVAACPELSLKSVREFSYANVLYREVRSAFIHEYQSGDKADMWTMAEDADLAISYGNWMGDPDRHIHFPVAWFCSAALSIAAAADEVVVPLSQPALWWVDGA